MSVLRHIEKKGDAGKGDAAYRPALLSQLAAFDAEKCLIFVKILRVADMGVASRHWPQRNALRPHRICLLSFILVWSVTVHADKTERTCYIGDKGCDACRVCINPSTKQECACLLRSGTTSCDIVCMSGDMNGHIADWMEVGAALFGCSVVVAEALFFTTLYFSMKVCDHSVDRERERGRRERGRERERS